MAASNRGRVRASDVGTIILAVMALAAGSVLGWNSRTVDLLVAPPIPVRAALAVAAVLVAFVLLGRSIDHLRGASALGPLETVRGIRLAFLSLAALAAAGGWLIGHPLPIVVALVIGAVDVLETTFLLAVVATQR